MLTRRIARLCHGVRSRLGVGVSVSGRIVLGSWARGFWHSRYRVARNVADQGHESLAEQICLKLQLLELPQSLVRGGVTRVKRPPQRCVWKGERWLESGSWMDVFVTPGEDVSSVCEKKCGRKLARAFGLSGQKGVREASDSPRAGVELGAPRLPAFVIAL